MSGQVDVVDDLAQVGLEVGAGQVLQVVQGLLGDVALPLQFAWRKGCLGGYIQSIQSDKSGHQTSLNIRILSVFKKSHLQGFTKESFPCLVMLL